MRDEVVDTIAQLYIDIERMKNDMPPVGEKRSLEDKRETLYDLIREVATQREIQKAQEEAGKYFYKDEG